MASKSFSILVAAFDFGTTFSGYAFSFHDDPLKVVTNQNWVAGSEKLISLKTPTCLLLNDRGTFDSFGFEAENKYATLAEDGEHHGWRLFRRFKMLLHNNKTLTRQSTVEDISGKSMNALEVFAMAIRYLQQHFLDALKKQTSGVLETDIQYVITVPAIWDDNAKQFMREAAIKAGLDSKRVKLALEPEAASLWCQKVTSDAQLALAGTGTRYMVVDLGGGTADISVHEKQTGDKLKEIHKASGGPWGGIYVDEGYMKFLTSIFSSKALEELKSTEMGDYFDILREFETKKRNFTDKKSEMVTFRISSALRELSEKHNKEKGLADKVAEAGYGDKVSIRGRDKLRVDSSVMKKWFDDPICRLIHHINDLLRDRSLQNVNTILLVGGFGESTYVQTRIEAEIGQRNLIVPSEAGLAVLKGAVRFGHDSSAVESRILSYSYGFSGSTTFDKNIHPASAMVDENGEKKVRSAFIVLARANDEIKFGQEVTIGREAKINATKTKFPIIRSTDPSPVFEADPNCEQIGYLRVYHPKGETKAERKMNVTFIFGETELKVKVKIRSTGKESYLCIDCLE